MKKVLFFLIMLLTMITTVKAGDILDYEFAWKSEPVAGPLFYSYEFKDGYLFEDYNENAELTLSYYNYKGSLIKSKKIETKIVGILVDDYIYLEAFKKNDDDTYRLTVSAYNEKLEVVKEVVLFPALPESALGSVNNTSDYLDLIEDSHKYYAGTNPILIDDYIYVVGLKAGVEITPDTQVDNMEELMEVRKYKKDLSSYTTITMNKETTIFLEDSYYEQHPDRIRIVERINARNFYIDSYDVKGDKTVVVGREEELPTVIRLYNKKNKVWEKNVEDASFYEVKFIDNYIMIAMKTSRTTSDLIILDPKDGKELKEIHNNNLQGSLLDTKRGFLLFEGVCQQPKQTPSGSAQSTVKYALGKITNKCIIHRNIYHIYNVVTPKVTSGKGKVTVEPKQAPDDQVTFTITPDEGYVLGKVKVTDSDGNVLVFTNNTFTMPHADVTIEVEFLVANAETKDIAIVTVALLFILSFIVIMVQKRKLNTLKVK